MLRSIVSATGARNLAYGGKISIAASHAVRATTVALVKRNIHITQVQRGQVLLPDALDHLDTGKVMEARYARLRAESPGPALDFGLALQDLLPARPVPPEEPAWQFYGKMTDVPSSPKNVNAVLTQIRSLSVPEAIKQLRFSQRIVARYIYTAIYEAATEGRINAYNRRAVWLWEHGKSESDYPETLQPRHSAAIGKDFGPVSWDADLTSYLRHIDEELGKPNWHDYVLQCSVAKSGMDLGIRYHARGRAARTRKRRSTIFVALTPRIPDRPIRHPSVPAPVWKRKGLIERKNMSRRQNANYDIYLPDDRGKMPQMAPFHLPEGAGHHLVANFKHWQGREQYGGRGKTEVENKRRDIRDFLAIPSLQDVGQNRFNLNLGTSGLSDLSFQISGFVRMNSAKATEEEARVMELQDEEIKRLKDKFKSLSKNAGNSKGDNVEPSAITGQHVE
eukprot:Clim_evm22s26 gene=Clim_evmTU22s26